MFIFSSCFEDYQNTSDNTSFTVATWNVENLFNGKDDGNEYDEFKEESGWNETAYKARLRNIKTVFSYFDADAVVLNEVENENVVSDIIENLGTYKYYTTAGEQDGAIKIAVISKVPIVSVKVHDLLDSRPILETELDTQNGTVHLFAVHGKSKRDSEKNSAKIRLNMGNVLSSVASCYSGDLTIIAGDFNEQVSEGNIFCDIRYTSTNAPLKVSPDADGDSWYNPFLDSTQELENYGTYWYNGQWSYIDNIIALCPIGCTPGKAQIIFKGILKNSSDKPNSYNRNLLTGVSDHLPVVASFDY